jgi:hypothetical protein
MSRRNIYIYIYIYIYTHIVVKLWNIKIEDTILRANRLKRRMIYTGLMEKNRLLNINQKLVDYTYKASTDKCQIRILQPLKIPVDS